MLVLVDTGILSGLLQPTDPYHGIVRDAVRSLPGRGDSLVIVPQNAAEFWNVCTRPAAAGGGFGLSIAETDRRLRVIERLFPVIPERRNAYPIWET